MTKYLKNTIFLVAFLLVFTSLNAQDWMNYNSLLVDTEQQPIVGTQKIKPYHDNILIEVQVKGEEVIANMTNKAESLQNLIQNVTSQNEQFNQNNQKMNILIEGFNKQKNESEQIISLLSDKLKELDLYLQDKKQIKMKQSKKGAKS